MSETSPRIDLILVGSRPGAVHAAARLGLRCLLLSGTPPSRTIARRLEAWREAGLDAAPEAEAARLEPVLADSGARGILAVGEQGVLLAAALRARLGLAGIDPATAERVRDKARMKARARERGVPCTDWHVLDATTSAEALVEALGLPLVVKHRGGAGSRGLVVARTPEDVSEALADIPPEARDALMAERFVQGVEMSVESFVLDGRILFTNPTEYYLPAHANIAPAHLEDAVEREVLDVNARAIDALGPLRGMTHLELFLTDRGPVFGELAVRPPGGRIMRLLRRAYGFDPWEAAIRLELGEAPDLPSEARGVAGAWMLHPGPGLVGSVRGLAAARRIRGVCKLVCRVRKGDRIEPRLSTGADVGWIEVRGPSRKAVAKRLQAAHDAIRIELAESPSSP